MTPSQQAKSVGLKSLTQVSEMSGVSLQTLFNWSKDKPKLFNIVLIGCNSRIDPVNEERIQQTNKRN